MTEADDALALFDGEFYASLRPDIVAAGLDPWEHYRAHGWLEGVGPHPLFDPRHYASQAGAGTPPLTHYLRDGWQQGLSPHVLFDPAFYTAQAGSAAGNAGAAPLLHYHRTGAGLGLSPHPLFDPAFYRAQQPGAGRDPFRHYVLHGWREGAAPHPLFDPAHYFEQRRDLRGAGIEPLEHYAAHGWREDTSPHPLFDPRHYRTEAAPDGPDLLHYMREGEAAGVWPNRLFAPYYYRMAHAALVGDAAPLRHFVEVGEALDLPTAPGFRPARYRSRHLWDLPGLFPLRHALRHGTAGNDSPLPAFPPARPDAPAGPPFVLLLLGPAEGEGYWATRAAAPPEASVVEAADVAGLRALFPPAKGRKKPALRIVLVAGDAFVATGDQRRLAAAAADGPAHPPVLDRLGDVVHAGYEPSGQDALPCGAGMDPAHPDLACARAAPTAGPVLAVSAGVLRRAAAAGSLEAVFLRASAGGRVVPGAQAVLAEAGHGRGVAGPVPLLTPAPTPRPRVLFVDSVVPRAGHDGGSSYVLQLLDAWRERGYDATILPEAELSAPPVALAPLQDRGVRVLQAPFAPSAEHYVATTNDAYAAVALCRAPCGGRHYEAARRRWPGARLLFHPVDLHHLREARDAALHGNADAAAAASRTEARELRLAREADATVVLSSHELDVLQAAGAGDRAAWVPPERAGPPPPPFDPASRQGVLFVGSYWHSPNADAVDWLCRDIWPRVQSLRPGTPLLLAGSNMPAAVDGAGAGVTVLGHVPDLHALLAAVRLTVAPLRTGAGVKLKLLDSLAAGVPAVCTSVAAEGTGLHNGDGFIVADTVEALAQAIVAAHDDPPRLRALAAAALAATGRFAPGTVRAQYWAATGVPPWPTP